MIDANELRIGNKIRRISNGNICTVNWGIIKDAEEGNTRDYESIPLTSQILLANRFYKTMPAPDIVGSEILFTIEYERLFPFELIYYAHNCYKYRFRKGHKTIPTVHELQNLFYFINDEELNITL